MYTIKTMKIRYKLLSMMLILVLSLAVSSCNSSNIKEDLNAEMIAVIFQETNYSTWLRSINTEDLENYKYESELKVFNPQDESKDYILIYFFNNIDDAKAYEKEFTSKSGLLHFFSFIYGENTKVKYERYDYMIVESYKNRSAKSTKEMIRIFEKLIYEKS